MEIISASTGSRTPELPLTGGRALYHPTRISSDGRAPARLPAKRKVQVHGLLG